MIYLDSPRVPLIKYINLISSVKAGGLLSSWRILSLISISNTFPEHWESEKNSVHYLRVNYNINKTNINLLILINR